MRIKSVSQHLLPPTDKLTVKLSVNLLTADNRDSYYNIYESDMGAYLTLNISSCIILQYKEVGGFWDKSYQIHISDDNIFQVNRQLQKFYRTLSNPKMFIYSKDGTITCNYSKHCKEVIQLRNGEIMELEPAVIFDNMTPLPGVNLYINNSKNKADMSIDEFEAMMYKFSKIDIGALGLQLINMRLLLDKQMADTQRESNPSFRNKQPMMNIFQKKSESEKLVEKEFVEDNRVTNSNEVKSINDLL